METATSVALPDVLPYLLAIFGLLVLWQYYQLHVMKGRILAIDIFDRSGIRMYLYAVADDSHACEVCRSAHGTVFPPSEVMKRVLVDQGNMQELHQLYWFPRRFVRRVARSSSDRRAITIVSQARTDTIGPG